MEMSEHGDKAPPQFWAWKQQPAEETEKKGVHKNIQVSNEK